MARIFSMLVMVLMIVLLPPAALAYISNDAIPTDKIRYPIKRKLEEGILLIASLNPKTKALFQVDRSQRRYKETKTLISKNRSLPRESIRELILQTKQTSNEINDLSNVDEKKELQSKLSDSIKEIKSGLHASEKYLTTSSLTQVPANANDPQAQVSPSPTVMSYSTPATPGVTPAATPRVTPLAATPPATPRPTPGVTPTATARATPVATPRSTPQATPPAPLPPPPPPPAQPPNCSNAPDPLACRISYCDTITDQVAALQCYQDILDEINAIESQEGGPSRPSGRPDNNPAPIPSSRGKPPKNPTPSPSPTSYSAIKELLQRKIDRLQASASASPSP